MATLPYLTRELAEELYGWKFSGFRYRIDRAWLWWGERGQRAWDRRHK